ncbi:MAG: hypothetical protein ACJ76L_01920 [Conexibacter sp.]
MIPHLPAAVLALVVALLAAASAAAAPVAPVAPPAPESLTLRLPDLGPNYELGSTRCGRRSHAEERWWPSTLPSLSERFPHRGCVIAFGESWAGPGPDYVMSAAFGFDDTAGPTAALQRPRAVAAHMLDAGRRGDLTPLSVDAPLGDDLRAFRLGGYPGPGTVLLWRSGSVLALVLAAGSASDRTTQAAVRLATAQQARIAAPTPLLQSDLDDVEVPLDDPHLTVPVQWLGRELRGAGGRPALSLDAVDGPNNDSPRGIEPYASLEYSSSHPRRYVYLELWRPHTMRRFLRSRVLSRYCVRRFDAHVEGINATLLGSYQPFNACPHSRPEVWSAIAFFHGVAVEIEGNSCYPCQARPRPYDSPAALRALLRALRVREPRLAP